MNRSELNPAPRIVVLSNVRLKCGAGLVLQANAAPIGLSENLQNQDNAGVVPYVKSASFQFFEVISIPLSVLHDAVINPE